MTEREAIYWKRYIYNVITEKINSLRVSDADAALVSSFIEHHMLTVSGQQMLPQSVFREFVMVFSRIPEMQEDIARAQEEITAWMDGLGDANEKLDALQAALDSFATEPLNECSKKQIEQMFDGEMWDADGLWLPSMDIDDEGGVALNIEVDDDGGAHFLDD